ncbi:trimeric intracellular cation channel family protein [Halioxenophilus aromaticivorans]|uniref:TRIC cation channel family protein n=1 Tax=Halioxenophilus aromaticivorans TaxID=1306992 RepID=A0AAV3U541_9ALTE
MAISTAQFLDFFGVAVFAVAGALTAIQKRFDIFGVIVVALITALGGGTLRDVSLDAHPVIWIANTSYLITGIGAAVVTFLVARWIDIPQRTLAVCDAIGLAFFAVAGMQKAVALGHSGEIALLMGVMTGVAGGILRDVLCNDVPLIFHREIYATAVIAGGVVFLILRSWGWLAQWYALAAMLVILVLRLSAIFLGLSLPQWMFSRSKGSRL